MLIDGFISLTPPSNVINVLESSETWLGNLRLFSLQNLKNSVNSSVMFILLKDNE